VQGDLAVRSRAQPVAASLELVLDRLEPVELSVDDDPGALVLAGDRLIAGREVDDAQPRMAEGHASVGRDPVALSVRSAVEEALRRSVDRRGRDGRLPGKDGCNAAHVARSLSGTPELAVARSRRGDFRLVEQDPRGEPLARRNRRVRRQVR
jgi:hypothetical protein